ncbi:MAG TPA: pyridoxamine 5'-phosphate oxidase family protein [Solirubrobacteraceae bacterium]|nr:pyridoxamine 5'-phosphate oxidase family protein [Solirubrobacteraceae bacterium]
MSGSQAIGSSRAIFELTRRESLDLLATCHVGRLAVHGGGVAPIVRPLNYVFDPRAQAVVFRTAHGTKMHSLLHETHATFEVDEFDPDTQTGWSVLITGVTEPLVRRDDIRRAEALGLEPWVTGERTNWVRIRAWTVSGRRVTETRSSAESLAPEC